MTTYYVFCGRDYYPGAGFGDLVFVSTDLEEAQAHFAGLEVGENAWALLYEAAPGEWPERIGDRYGEQT